MKKMSLLLSIAAAAAVLFSACSTVSNLVPGGVSLPTSVGGGSGAAASALKGAADFRDGEVLCGNGTDIFQAHLSVARVLTQPQAATKNQAEVVFVSDGKKEWVTFVIPSKKASKESFAVGKAVLVPYHHAEDKEIETDAYRKANWSLGRVTSLDEMFKDLVEVDGRKYYWKYTRIPDKDVQ